MGIEIFLLALLPASLSIYGVHILFQEGHLLEKLGDKLRGPERSPDKPLTFREKVMKPIFDCPICMASVWGTIWFFAGLEITFDIDLPLRFYVPYVFCLCGMNTIIQKLTNTERTIL